MALHRVAEVFRSGWKAYVGAHRVLNRLKQVARHIMDCRTDALGGRLYRCDACGAEVPLYNSCRDRHCPTCQTLRKQRWLEQRRAEVLPVPYFQFWTTSDATPTASRSQTTASSPSKTAKSPSPGATAPTATARRR